MNSKILSSAGIVSVGMAVGLLLACGQANPTSTSGSGSPDSTTDALNTVIGCQAQAFACAADAQAPAGLTSCNGELRSCLATLVPDAGGFAFPQPPRLDGGSNLRSHAARVRRGPTRPDVRRGTAPAAAAGRFSRRRRCVATGLSCRIADCLTTTFDVTKCATDARTCLTAADKARCDAQQAACTASGAPKPLCDAERAACL